MSTAASSVLRLFASSLMAALLILAGGAPALAQTATVSTVIHDYGDPTFHIGDTPTFSAKASPVGDPDTFIPTGSFDVYLDGQFKKNVAIDGAWAFFNLGVFNAVGEHEVVVEYVPADGTYAASPSAPLPFTVSLHETTPVLTISPAQNPVSLGTTLTFTLDVFRDVDAATHPSGGTIRVYNNGSATPYFFTYTGTPRVISFPSTIPPLPPFPAGDYNFKLVYTGSATDAASESATVPLTITKYQATLTLDATPTTVATGQAVTLTATVGAPVVPTGETIQFFDGEELIGSDTTDDGPIVSISTSLKAGVRQITARYAGSANIASAVSNVVEVTVDGIETTTGLAATPDTATAGGSTTLTAAVAPATATGSVSFRENGTQIASIPVANGTASFEVEGLTGGTHVYTAHYLGDTTHEPSDSSEATVQVGKAPTSVALDPGSQTVAVGAPAPLAATIVSGTGSQPTGTATLMEGDDVLDAQPLANGTATFSPLLGQGSHSLHVQYSGDADHEPSTSATATVLVSAALPSTTTVVVDPASPTTLDAPTATATVGGQSGPGSGTVEILIDGGTPSPLVLAGGSATIPLDGVGAGDHEIEVRFPGDGTYAPSSGTASFTISRVPATAQLTLPTTIAAGDDIAATVVVTGAGPSPTGTVRLFSGPTQLQIAILSGGQASFALPDVPAGTLSLHVEYDGDDVYLPASSNVETRTVERIPTTLSLSSSANPALVGTANTITATVLASGMADGQVLFSIDGGTPSAVALNNGHAALDLSALPTGTYSIVASYQGTDLFAAAADATISQTISPRTATVSLTPSPTPSDVGATVRLDIVVSAEEPSTGTPSGQVRLSIDGNDTVVPLDNGSASIDVNGLSAGVHELEAEYEGDALFSSAISGLVLHSVQKIASVTTLGLAPNPVVPGQQTALTATVAAGSGTPAGSISFLRAGVEIAEVELVDGVATTTYTETSVGSFGYSAVYSGSDTHALSSSSTVQLEVGQASATISIDAPPAPYPAGVPQTIGATVAPVPAGSTPTGTVAFSIDAGAPIVISLTNGSASFEFPASPAGTYTIAAAYSGDANHSPASSSISRTVVPQATTLQISSSLASLVLGQTTTLTVQATAPNGIPQGDVLFEDENGEIGTVSLDASGTASIPWTPTTSGQRTAEAAFAGDPLYFSPGSASITVSVADPGLLEAAVGISGPSEIDAGTTAQLVVSVAPAVGTTPTPTGSVQIVVDGVPGGTSPLVNGSATIATPALTEGPHSIVANYSGDSAFNPSTSTPFAIVALPVELEIETTTSLSVPASATIGQPAPLVATVTSTEGAPNGGAVEFFVDDVSIGSFPLTTGAASTSYTPSATGTLSIRAEYSGFDDFLPSDDAESLQVTAAPQDVATTTSVLPSSTQTTAGQSIAVQITVASLHGTPTGQVDIRFDGQPDGTYDLVGGQAAYATPPLTVGPHTIEAFYLGTTGFAASQSGGVSVMGVPDEPEQVATTTTLGASPSPSHVGELVVLTAQISAADDRVVDTGTVTFFVGDEEISSSAPVNGIASATWTSTAAGNVAFTATYSGSGVLQSSSSTMVHQVDPVPLAATTSTVTYSASPIVLGQSVTLTASVESATGTPQGDVSFLIATEPTLVATLQNGTVGVSWTPTVVGTFSITVVYPGDATHAGSTSTPVQVVVEEAPALAQATATLTASPNPVQAGLQTVLTATVSPVAPATATPTGNVEFFRDGSSVGIVALDAGSAQLTLPTPNATTHSLTAVYAGDSSYGGATSAAVPLQVTADPVDPIVTTTALQPPQDVVVGSTYTIRATVSAQSGTATGSVSFAIQGQTPVIAILDNGVATISWTPLVAGSYEVVATYAPDPGFAASTSVAVTIPVSEAPSDPVATTTTLIIDPDPPIAGGNAVVTATVVATDSSQVTGSVAFSFDGGTPVVVALANGSATIPAPTLVAGQILVEAEYLGDAGHDGSTATLTRQVSEPPVELVPTDTTVSVPDLTVGVEAVIEADVLAISGTPSGSIVFWVDGQPFAPAPMSNGSASTTWTPTTAGTHAFVAVYSGSQVHAASTSAVATAEAFEEQTNKLQTTTGVSLSSGPTFAGETITATATVQPTSGSTVPTGSVAFSLDGGVQQVVALTNGSASWTSGPLSEGTASIVATYSGDDGHLGSTSTPATRAVEAVVEPPDPIPSGTILSISPETTVLGNAVTLTANVVSADPRPRTGSVEFRLGPAILGSAALANGTGSIQWTPPSTGDFGIQAIYSGDATFLPSGSAVENLHVDAAPAVKGKVSIVLTLQDADLHPGDTATVVATVQPIAPATYVPTGTVFFLVDDQGIPAIMVNGMATLEIPGMAAGTTTIDASYSGDAAYDPEDADAIVIEVEADPTEDVTTTSALSSSSNPAAIGQIVAYDLVVTAADASTPTGLAILTIGGTQMPPVALQNGAATWTTTFSQAGQTDVSATYVPDDGWSASTSNTIQQAVSPPAALAGSITIRQIAGGPDATFQFSSDAPGLTGSITTSNGSGERGPVEVQPGTYSIVARDAAEAGYVLSMVQCSDGDSVGDAASRQATVNVSAGEAVVCTFSSIDARGRTVETIQDFLDARADIIVGNLPAIDRRIDRLQGRSGGAFSPGNILMGYSSVLDGAPMRFSGSLAAIDAAAGNQQPNRFDVWAEGSFGALNRGSGAEGLYGVVAIGADYLFDDDLLAGIVFQYDAMGLEAPGGDRIEGSGWLLGPYMTMRLGEGVYLDLLAAAGRADNQVSPLGTYTDEFASTRILLDATLQGEWENGPWIFSPRAKATWFQEWTDAYTDSLGIQIPSVATATGTLAIGPGIAYAFSLEAIEMEIGARVDAIADLVGSGGLTIDDLRARVEGSVDITFDGGAALDLSVHYDGVGTANNSYGAKAGLLVPIN